MSKRKHALSVFIWHEVTALTGLLHMCQHIHIQCHYWFDILSAWTNIYKYFFVDKRCLMHTEKRTVDLLTIIVNLTALPTGDVHTNYLAPLLSLTFTVLFQNLQ